MGITVHIVDVSIRSNADDFERKSTQNAGDVVVRVAASCNGVAQALSDAYSATTDRSIEQLIFYGHGATGLQGVATGKDGKNASPELAALSLESLDNAGVKTVFGQLTRRFSSGGEIVLLGCHTGESAQGTALIKKLARIAGVPVKAATTYQIVGHSDLVGTIKFATPGGTVSENSIEGIRNYFGSRSLFEEAVLAGAELWHKMGF
jgi:hypothetical protein